MREANLGCPSAGTIKLEFRTADQKLVGETGPVPATVLITHAYRNAKQVVDINSIWFLEALFDETSLVLVYLRGDAAKYSGRREFRKTSHRIDSRRRKKLLPDSRFLARQPCRR